MREFSGPPIPFAGSKKIEIAVFERHLRLPEHVEGKLSSAEIWENNFKT
jgi:hypothetical protein